MKSKNIDVTDDYAEMMLIDLENGEDLYLKDPDEAEEDEDGNLIKSYDEDFENGYLDNESENLDDIQADDEVEPVETIADEYDKQLQIGRIVELEHIHWWVDANPDLSDEIIDQLVTNIAKDHIKQTSNYYTKLIQAGLVDEQDALDLYQELYGSAPSPVKKENKLPLPPMNKPNVKSLGCAYKANVNLNPNVADAQPDSMTENVKNDFNDYGSFINENATGSLNINDATYNINLDEFDV